MAATRYWRLAEMERALAHTGCQGAVRRTCELVRAECLYETGQSQAAAQILERHLVEGLRHGVTETAMAGLETAIRLRELDAGVGPALTLSREAEHTIEAAFRQSRAQPPASCPDRGGAAPSPTTAAPCNSTAS